MRLAAVYFERNVPTGTGARVDSLHADGDPWHEHYGWSLWRREDGGIDATKSGKTVTLDGYAYTCELAAPESVVEGFVPPPPSAADSGVAVMLGESSGNAVGADEAGSTPARSSRKQRNGKGQTT